MNFFAHCSCSSSFSTSSTTLANFRNIFCSFRSIEPVLVTSYVTTIKQTSTEYNCGKANQSTLTIGTHSCFVLFPNIIFFLQFERRFPFLCLFHFTLQLFTYNKLAIGQQIHRCIYICNTISHWLVFLFAVMRFRYQFIKLDFALVSIAH